MGRGNVCVSGPYEGLYYIDNDDYYVYRRDDPYVEEPETRLMGDLSHEELTSSEWYYDEIGTGEELADIEECFMEDFTRMFPSFKRSGSNKWLKNGPYGDYTRRAILESGLFHITVEYNEWSMAVELVQKEVSYSNLLGLQAHHYQKYLSGMKKCLLARLPRVGTYCGAWTSGTISRDEVL